MGTKFDGVAVSNYNASPPSDDGTQSEANKVKYSTIKTKLGDPVKSAVESLSSELATALDQSCRSVAASDSAAASDHNRTIQVTTSSVTLTLADAATMGTGYIVSVANQSTGTIKVALATATDLIDGKTNAVQVIPAKELRTYIVNAATNGYLTRDHASIPISLCEGRLTLSTGVPVTTTDVTAAETLYFTPYKGNRIALFDGGSWKIYPFSEVSIDVPDVTGVHDVFIYDNSGTLTLELVAWTNDTTRATALTTQDGILVKTGETNKRYLGTFYSTTAGNGQIQDSAANRYLWNYYNRVRRQMKAATETTDSWNHTSITLQQANANANNQLNFVIGVSEDAVEAMVLHRCSNSGGAYPLGVYAGIGLDATNANATGALLGIGSIEATGYGATTHALWKGYPGIGKHYLAWLEASTTSGTTTWRGDGGVASLIQTGINGSLFG